MSLPTSLIPLGLTPGETAALELLFIVLTSVVIASFISAAIVIYRSIKMFGSKGFTHSVVVYLSIMLSFFAFYMGASIILVFGKVLLSNPAGWSIVIGLVGIETVGILRIIAIWESRANGM